MSDVVKQIKSTNEALASLRDDVPRLEDLLARRDAEYRKARSGGLDIDEVAELRARRDAVENMLSQHRQEIAEVEAELAELESAAADERELAAIAAGTTDYRAAERDWYRVMDEAEAAVRRAVTLSKHLNGVAQQAYHRAWSAAVRLADKHGDGDANGHLARAVVGSDVEPVRQHGFNVPVWPNHDYGGRFRGMARIGNTQGLFAEVDPEEELA